MNNCCTRLLFVFPYALLETEHPLCFVCHSVTAEGCCQGWVYRRDVSVLEHARHLTLTLSTKVLFSIRFVGNRTQQNSWKREAKNYPSIRTILDVLFNDSGDSSIWFLFYRLCLRHFILME